MFNSVLKYDTHSGKQQIQFILDYFFFSSNKRFKFIMDDKD